MKLPPALTWMSLFGSEASFSCDASVPAWMRAQIEAARPQLDGPLVSVGGNTFDNRDGYVGINARIGNKAIESAGFKYIRRFAVLPDLQTARWFVPLDSPAVSSAGFSLYSPAKLSARLKVLAARLAAHSRLPVWYRDTILIAQRTIPPIEQKISELFGTPSLRLALSSGAPEPARNRKVSAAVMGLDGRVVGFGKIAGSDLSRRLLGDESRALPELGRRNIGAPELLFAGEVDGAFVTFQKPLKGKPVTSSLTPSKLALLASLRSQHVQRASECNMVASLPARIQNLPIPHPELAEALQDLLPTLEETQVASTIVHGDFAPWNLREHNGKSAAFDWEYAELDGLPLVDEMHYRIQVGYLLDNWTLKQASELLAQMQMNNDLGLRAEQVRALQAVYLIDNLARLFAEGYDETENEMVGWYCQLLERLVVRPKEMVAA